MCGVVFQNWTFAEGRIPPSFSACFDNHPFNHICNNCLWILGFFLGGRAQTWHSSRVVWPDRSSFNHMSDNFQFDHMSDNSKFNNIYENCKFNHISDTTDLTIRLIRIHIFLTYSYIYIYIILYIYIYIPVYSYMYSLYIFVYPLDIAYKLDKPSFQPLEL